MAGKLRPHLLAGVVATQAEIFKNTFNQSSGLGQDYRSAARWRFSDAPGFWETFRFQISPDLLWIHCGLKSRLFSVKQFGVEQRSKSPDSGYVLGVWFLCRPSTREAGLKGLVNALSTRIMTDLVEQQYETLTHQFLACVKRCSSATEAVLACYALGMLSITVGAGVISEHVLGEAFSHLVKLAKVGSSALARTAALDAIAILTFVGGVDVQATDDAIDVFWQIISHKGNSHADQASGVSKPAPAVKAAAMTAWTFLVTTLSSSQIAARKFSMKIPVFSSLLDAQDLGVRKATGEAVALLCEASDEIAYEHVTQSIIEQIKELAIGANRQGQAKKEQTEQRSLFREILSTIEGGVCRETTLKLQHGDVLKINTWSQTVQLNFFRKFLGEGFQKHMQENSLLHEVFDYTPRQNARSSKEKRKMLTTQSMVSKLRTQRIQRKRDEALRNCGDLLADYSD